MMNDGEGFWETASNGALKFAIWATIGLIVLGVIGIGIVGALL